MGISKLLSCFAPGVDSGRDGGRESSRRFSREAGAEKPSSIGDSTFQIKVSDICGGEVERMAADCVGGTVAGISKQDSVTRPPLPYGKRLSKRKLAKLRKAEEEAERLAKAEEAETMSRYLGKSASCSSLNSLPCALSSTPVSRCATPDRRRTDAMVQFDGEGKVVVRNRQGSFGSEASWSLSEAPTPTPSSLLGTPDGSHLRGMGNSRDALEMSDLTSVSHSMSLTDFTMSIDAEGHETMEFIPKAIRSVSNPRYGQHIVESIFRTRGDTVVVGGGSRWGSAGHAAAGAELRPASSSPALVMPIRRNVSWSHISTVNMGLSRSASETTLNRRHTVLVLTNHVEDDCVTSDEEEMREMGEKGEMAEMGETTEQRAGGQNNKTPGVRNAPQLDPRDSNRSNRSKRSKSWDQLPTKVIQVFESHHVHLSKLHDQMGDATKAPEDLLQLMSRKIFDSRSDLASSIRDVEEEHDAGLCSTLSSHDLSDCSDRLPKIRTRSVRS